MLSHNKNMTTVMWKKKCGFLILSYFFYSIVLFHRTAAPPRVWISFFAPRGKFRCKLIHLNGCQIGIGVWLLSVSIYLLIHCWSLKCQGALLCVKIYVILHGLMWNVHTPERPFGLHAVKYSRILYTVHIVVYRCMWMFLWIDVEWFSFFFYFLSCSTMKNPH